MNETCEWTQDRENNYETSCGHLYCIIEGTQFENDMKFCTFCGKNINQELCDEAISG
jgi:hypothetical protein